jgi:hypothetical protein
VSNDTDQPREVEVELRTPDGIRTQIARVPARNSTTLRWDYTPKSLGEQRFVLIARERGGRLRDAEERTLTVKPLSLTETDSRAVLLNAERTLTLTLRPDAIPTRRDADPAQLPPARVQSPSIACPTCWTTLRLRGADREAASCPR